MLQTHGASGKGRDYWLPLGIVAIVFALAAGWRIALPGLNMDAVYPDYLATRILNPHGHQIPPWVLPGNYLAKRFPILPSLYHGSLQVWLDLPLFMLMGTTLLSLRVAHALFAFGIIWSVYALLSRRDLPRGWVALACVALALDPAFVYAFRTQSGLSTAPVMWVFLSILKLSEGVHSADGTVRRDFWSSGAFFGLAVYGYFTYLFFLPAVLVALLVWGRRSRGALQPRLRHVLVPWAIGFCCGMAFYLLGYTLLAINQGGLGGLLGYIEQMQARLGAFSSQLSLVERVRITWQLLADVLSNSWNSGLILGDSTPAPAAPLKIAILISLPALLWAIAEYRKTASGLLRVLLGLELSYFVASLVFGGRLAGHHYVCLVPLSYAALAVALVDAPAAHRDAPQPSGAARSVAATLAFLILIGINIAGDKQMTAKLADTHGVGLFSDAIDRFADDVLRYKRENFVVLSDWGLFMPVVFLTGANVQVASADDFEAAKHFLCHQRDVSVGLITGDRAARFADWQKRLQWEQPSIESYRQRDGKIVFEVGTFKANPSAETCRR